MRIIHTEQLWWYSNIIICYRRWLLGKLFEEICLDDSSSHSSDSTHQCSGTKSSSIARVSYTNVVWQSHSDLRHCVVLRELSVCHAAADRYHSNYNAWNHRIWVMDKFTCCRTQVCVIPSTHHHHHIWPAPLRVHSATCSQQPPERAILIDINYLVNARCVTRSHWGLSSSMWSEGIWAVSNNLFLPSTSMLYRCCCMEMLLLVANGHTVSDVSSLSISGCLCQCNMRLLLLCFITESNLLKTLET